MRSPAEPSPPSVAPSSTGHARSSRCARSDRSTAGSRSPPRGRPRSSTPSCWRHPWRSPLRLLAPRCCPRWRRRCADVDYASAVMVTLAVPKAQIDHPLDASGFLVAPAGGPACSPPARGRRSSGPTSTGLTSPILRASAGRHGDTRAARARPDDDLVDGACSPTWPRPWACRARRPRSASPAGRARCPSSDPVTCDRVAELATGRDRRVTGPVVPPEPASRASASRPASARGERRRKPLSTSSL